ncbi:glycoside hydrolase family 108 protein [Teichococcus cervicalis]|uniref:Predicted Peptidoglycan domain protein n=1 Tax=Pseudoroseomonas cervicalis ATCC 49957 TaxID=525371 RepID=D5RM61_9PROT|nr:glycosyl hydrolase 108 family protein [Pseudoroseomonas cervicalis]EFH11613.1 predicted Peptidoglycan domain protein [Pseudoroseomonas cervicalis ATCC 49957]
MFEAAFEVLIGHEGGLSMVASDPGNWTGGKVGSGQLRGTRYGISAAAFPTLDIASLTLDQARAIYRAMYWQPLGADDFPPATALVLFDSAVNNGVSRAVRFLQLAVGSTADGLLGTATRAATRRKLGNGAPEQDVALASEIHARRIDFMARLSTWPTFGLGWARRLASLPFQAAALSTR